MDILFEKLLETIEKFIQLAEEAPYKLTGEAIRDNDLTDGRLKKWNEMLAKAKDRCDKLSILLNDGFEKNKSEVDRYLSFYRQLSRYLEEKSCYWSLCYDEIKRKCLPKISMFLTDIDRKYKMDWHQND